MASCSRKILTLLEIVEMYHRLLVRIKLSELCIIIRHVISCIRNFWINLIYFRNPLLIEKDRDELSKTWLSESCRLDFFKICYILLNTSKALYRLNGKEREIEGSHCYEVSPGELPVKSLEMFHRRHTHLSNQSIIINTKIWNANQRYYSCSPEVY